MTGTSKGNRKRFRLKRFSEIKLSTNPNYLIKGILPRVGLAVIWGPPKCGKSFWTFDAVMHIALNWQYRGRKVQPGTVVYCALEGGTGFARRVEAWRQRYLAADHHDVPFFLLDVPLDLIADHAALIEDITEQITDAPSPVCIVIDTLNRALAGSENKPDDMAKFIRAADALRVAFDCLVVIIHHSGIEGGRPRGHTSLPGADDVQIKVQRDANGTGAIIATVEHMKDDEAGATVASALDRVELGLDDDGAEISSCVIVASDGGAAGPAKAALGKGDWGKGKGGKGLKLLRRIVTNLIAECGEDLRPWADGPVVRAIKPEMIRAEFVRSWPADGETERVRQNARTQAYRRAIAEAVDRGGIVLRELRGEDFVWLASAATSPDPGQPKTAAPSLASWEVDDLRQRGFSSADAFGMNPEYAREILADPERTKLTERYGRGADAPPDTVCRICKKPGARLFGEPIGPGVRRDRFPGATPLHLECCEAWFESGLPVEDGP